MTRNLWRALIVLIVFFAVSAATFAKGGAEKPAPAATSGTQPTGPYAEHFNISYSGAGSSGAWLQKGNKADQWIDNKYNVTLTPILFDATNADAQNIQIASGRIPDLGFFYKTVAQMNNQGVIRGIPESMIRKYAPDYAAAMDKDPFGWKINKMPGKTNEYGALSGYNAQLEGFSWANMFRLDWLQKVGIQPKGKVVEIAKNIYWTDQAFTTTEFENIMKAFTKDDPNGDGKNDTYGMSPGPYIHYSYGSLIGAFGLSNYINVKQNGQAVPYYSATAYESLLSFLSNLYNKGYVDPEVATQNLRKAWSKFTQGIAGWQTVEVGYIDPTYADRPPYSLIDRDPNAKILITPPMIGTNGQQMSPQYVNSPWSYTWYIGKQVSDAELARILQVYDGLSFDPQAFVVSSYGFPGVTFNWEGKAYDSAVIMKKDLSVPEKAKEMTGLYTAFRAPSMMKFLVNSALKVVKDFSATPAGKAMTTYPSYVADLFGQYADQTKTWNDQFQSDNNLIVTKFFADAQTGANVQGTWDNYIQQLNDTGGLKQYISLINKWPIVANEVGSNDK